MPKQAVEYFHNKMQLIMRKPHWLAYHHLAGIRSVKDEAHSMIILANHPSEEHALRAHNALDALAKEVMVKAARRMRREQKLPPLPMGELLDRLHLKHNIFTESIDKTKDGLRFRHVISFEEHESGRHRVLR